MSMLSHGRSRWTWVCRCSSGLDRAFSPPIHIFAGENVCIQAITPTHDSSALAASSTLRMESGSDCTGKARTRSGSSADSPSAAASVALCSATCASASGPYKCWLPVRNQTSRSCSAFTPPPPCLPPAPLGG